MWKSMGVIVAALALGLAPAGSAVAQGAGGPVVTSQPAVSDSQKTTAVNSNTQSQVNATVNFTLSGIGSAIQRGLLGRAVPG